MFLILSEASFFGLVFLCQGSHLSLILEVCLCLTGDLSLDCERVPRPE
jgi:hypothetical protein